MLNYLKIIAFSCALMLGAATHAHASSAAPADNGKVEPVITVNTDALKKLITTLESETARTDFIQNLKTLAETQAKPADAADTSTVHEAEEAMAPLTKTLGVEEFTTTAIDKYEAFLVRNDLKGSTVGRIALSLLTLVVGAGFIFLLRRAATKLLYWIDHAVEWINLPAARMRVYARVLRAVVTLGLMGLMLYTITLIWDFKGENNPFESHTFRTAIGLMINIGFVIALATVAWETLNALLQLVFKRADGGNSTRALTILPIVRNIVFLVFAVLFSLVLLSELGINILPLLAGAGIVGVAIGFGAQTMVKDFLSGFTLILEDVMRVGDVVRINDFSGTVEKITLRKIQIRGASGTVFTIPFSAINVIQNQTKDFSAFEFTYTMPFETDVEKLFDVLRQTAAEMKQDPTFGPLMLETIDIWGVDNFSDTGMVIKGRIKTLAGKHWAVQREFHRRKSIAFANAGLPPAAMPRSYQITETVQNEDTFRAAPPFKA